MILGGIVYMFCKHCGKNLPDGSQFCNGCGKNLAIVEATPQINEAPKPKEKRRVDYNNYLEQAKKIDILSILFAISAIILVVTLLFVPIFNSTIIPLGGNYSNFNFDTGTKSFSILEELQVFIYAGQNNLPMNWWGNFEFILIIVVLAAMTCWSAWILGNGIRYLLNNKKSASVKVSILRRPKNQERAVVIIYSIWIFLCLFLDVTLAKDNSPYFSARYMTGFNGFSAWVIIPLLAFALYITMYVIKMKEEIKVKKAIVAYENGQD